MFEILVLDDELRELVVNKSSSDVIRKKGIEKGMRLLRDDAIMKALFGVTTLEEALTAAQVD